MNSGISTERQAARAPEGFEAWHFYVLLAMVAATAAVMLSRSTHPAALLALSAAVVAAGLVGLAMHRALASLIGEDDPGERIGGAERERLEREKALTLRSIKELEFDRAMGKVSGRDFDDLAGRLRARALILMEELERLAAAEATPAEAGAEAAAAPVPAAATPRAAACGACGTPGDPDARFCKACGARLSTA